MRGEIFSASSKGQLWCGPMKRIFLLAMALVTATSAETGLYQRMTLEERRAAGIEQLSSEQQAALDQAARRVEKETVGRVVATVKAETRAEVQAEQKARKLAAVGLNEAEVTKGTEIRANITGEFKGWNGHTTFNLDNGQVWTQTDPGEQAYFPRVKSTAVTITPAIFGTWQMKLVSEGMFVRVKRYR